MEKRLRYPRVVSKQKRIRAIFHTHKRNPPHPMQHTEKGEKKIEEEIEIGSSKESDLNKGKKIEEDSFYAFIDSKERDCNWLQDEDATVRAFASCVVLAITATYRAAMCWSYQPSRELRCWPVQLQVSCFLFFFSRPHITARGVYLRAR